MPNKYRVVIAGATGEIGQRLLDNLIAHNEIAEIHLLLRRPLNTPQPNVHEHIVDFEQLDSLIIDNPKQLETFAYCCLGTTIKKAGSKAEFSKVDLDYAINFAKWSSKHNCKKFAVISSLDAKASSKNFYLQTKGKMESALSDMSWESLWIFRPSLLTGQRQEFRFGEKLGAFAAKLVNPLLIGPYQKYRPIQMDKVAKSLSLLLDEDKQGVHIVESDQIESLAVVTK